MGELKITYGTLHFKCIKIKMEANVWLLLLLFSTHFVDVKSSNILEEMYKTLKNLEENVASNRNQMKILNQKIDANINMVEDLRNDLLTIKNDKHEAKTCNQCNKRSADFVVSGDDVYTGSYTADVFAVKNALTWNIPEKFPSRGHRATYWITPNHTPGTFILKFDQPRKVEVITLVNTHNGYHKDRGTKEFKVYLGDSEFGPWTEVLHDSLDDPKGTIKKTSSIPASRFSISPKCAQFVKFRMISWYGVGGGLQYFSTCAA